MAQAHVHIAKEVRTPQGRNLVCFYRHPNQRSPLPMGFSNNTTSSTRTAKHYYIQANSSLWKGDISKHWDLSNHQTLIIIVTYCQNQVRCIRIFEIWKQFLKQNQPATIRSPEIFYKVNFLSSNLCNRL